MRKRRLRAVGCCESESGWIEEAHGSDGSSGRPPQFFSVVVVSSVSPQRVEVVGGCQRLPVDSVGAGRCCCVSHLILLCKKLTESIRFLCVGTTEEIYRSLRSSSARVHDHLSETLGICYLSSYYQLTIYFLFIYREKKTFW
jgi:hypothetical protein